MKTTIFNPKSYLNMLLIACCSLFFLNANAQTNSCVKGTFKSEVNHNSKTVYFKSDVSSNVLVYNWAFGDGTKSQSKHPKHTYKKAGDYKVCLTIYGFNQTTQKRCSTTICKKVSIVDCARFKAGFDFKTSGLTVKLVSKANAPAHFGFTLGDGTLKRGKEIKHTYAKPGLYEVCLIAVDSLNGCTEKVCQKIKVEKPCNIKADFEYKLDGGVLIVAGKSNITNATYYYTVNGQAVIKGVKGRTKLDRPGDYKVCLVVKDPVQNCAVRVCKEVNLKCDLQAGFVNSVSGYNLNVRGKSSSPNAIYWYTLNGKVVLKNQVGVIKVGSPGNYKLCFNVKDTKTGCTVEQCKEVKIECDLEAKYRIVQTGKRIKVEGTANEEDVHYFWTFGDGNDAKGKKANHRYTKPGKYQVCLVVFNPRTRCKTCVCKTIVIEKPCRLRGDFTYNQVKNKFKFIGRSNRSDAVYYWNFGDGNKASGKRVRHKYSKKGIYTVTLTIASRKADCKITKQYKVKVGWNQTSTSFILDEVTENESLNKEIPLQEVDADWTAKVSPSLTKDKVAVLTQGQSARKVEVYNNVGILVSSQQNTTTKEIDTTKLRAGMYYVHVTADDGSVKILKFIKE